MMKTLSWMEALSLVALLSNAALFIPQAWQLFRAGTARGISLPTFGGFLIIQSILLSYGLYQHDWVLSLGYALSLCTCSPIVGLTLYYRKTQPKAESLEQSLHILETIIALMPGHVYWIDPQGRYLGCNDEQAQSAGLSHRRQIKGLFNQDLPWNHLSTQPEAMDRVNQQVMHSGQPLVIEEAATLQDGTQKIFLSHKVPLRYQGHILGMVGISVDISTLKQTQIALKNAKEQAEVANQAKMEFLYNIQHDMRTPLTGILAFAQWLDLQTHVEIKILKPYTHSLQTATIQLLAFLNQTLAFVEMAEVTHPLRHQAFYLKQTVQTILELNQLVALQKKLHFSYRYDPAIPEPCISDPIRIYKILLELTSNALKFTPTGSVTITLDWMAQPDRSGVLCLGVEDTGIGIAPEHHEAIFGRFKRLHPSGQRLDYPGLGLGLAIVKQLVDELGGTIQVQSALNQGTHLCCMIPYPGHADEAPPISCQPKLTTDNRNCHAKTI